MITVLGRIFPAFFVCAMLLQESAWLPFPGHEMTPDFTSGVISFPWVQSLGNLAFCWIDRALYVWLESLPQHSCSSAFVAIGIYVKRKILKAQPAGVLTMFGITFFRTISLPYLKGVYKTGKYPNKFVLNGVKRRIRNFSPYDN